MLTAMAAGALAGCAGPRSVTTRGLPASGPTRAATASGAPAVAPQAAPAAAPTITRAQVVARYGRLKPRTWGFGAPGELRVLPTRRRVLR
jgi:hypothetical protein